MKNYIQKHFLEKITYSHLQEAVKEAWDMITEEDLDDLIEKMGNRC